MKDECNCDQALELKRVLKEIITRIAVFDRQARSEQYTDTEDAWELFRWIRNQACEALGATKTLSDLQEAICKKDQAHIVETFFDTLELITKGDN